MKYKYKVSKVAVMGLFLLAGGMVNAGTIDENSVLLDDAGATMIESWLGQGDLDWTSVWYGETGVGGNMASWHAVTDTLTHTVSIYRAINALNQEVLIGGYTASNWAGNGIYKEDATAFIFNLTQDEFQQATIPIYATYATPEHFANFGGGHDLFAAASGSLVYSGFVRSFSYDPDKGTIDVGNGDNTNYYPNANFRILALETFTFVAAAPAVEPAPAVSSGPRPNIEPTSTGYLGNILRHR